MPYRPWKDIFRDFCFGGNSFGVLSSGQIHGKIDFHRHWPLTKSPISFKKIRYMKKMWERLSIISSIKGLNNSTDQHNYKRKCKCADETGVTFSIHLFAAYVLIR